jgi:ribosome-binding factor A
VSTRQSRVEQLLRREIAGALLRGEIKDHRVRQQEMISVTAVRVSPDLSVARVFIDVLEGGPKVGRVVEGLNAAQGVFKRHLGKVLKLRRTPSLRFEHDDSIEQGTRIEEVLAEIRAESPSTEPGPSEDMPPSADETDGSPDA